MSLSYRSGRLLKYLKLYNYLYSLLKIENNVSNEFDLKNQIIHRKTFKNYFSKNIINANTTEIAIVILIMLKNGSCRVSILPAKSARSVPTLFLLLFKKFIL